MNMLKTSKTLTCLYAILLAVLILSVSIAVPILFRPFYYAHIAPLELPQEMHASPAQIREAYNQVLDYCTGFSSHYASGIFPFSAQGADHFRDVRGLFLFDGVTIIISSVSMILLKIFSRFLHLTPRRIGRHGAAFWGPVYLMIGVSILSILVSLNFSAAFTIFHHLFFPGKENWLMDEHTDPVINMLPEVFFRNCAILIGACMIVLCVLLIFFDCKASHKKNTTSAAAQVS